MSDIKTSLKPTAPVLSKRYSKSVKVDIQHLTIPAALFTDAVDPEPQYLPPGWRSCVHPEGALYFHRVSQLNVVTGEDLSSVTASTHVYYWGDEIVKMFGEIGVPLSDSYELYLEFDQDELSCGYYIVDHSKRCIFWLEPVSTGDVGMNPAFSIDHLRYGLEEMYWSHVEFFPSHAGIPMNGIVDLLLNTLVHAQGDALTSTVSTFPYSAEESARFTKLIKPYQGKEIDGHIICVIARLNSFIASHKSINHFGQAHCRLSRDQSILDLEPSHTHWMSSALSRLLFGVPASFVDKFERLYLDTMVYTKDFREFFASCQEDRRLFINLSFGSVLMHFVLLSTGAGLGFLSPLGLFCGLVSIVSGVVLYSQHQETSQGSAGEGYSYLSERRHDIYGFQYLALLFSLPKAMFFWSVALFAPQVLFILYMSIGTIGCSALVLLSAWFAVVFQYKLVPASFHWLPSRNTSEDTDELASIV
jgi:hypothetical protein